MINNRSGITYNSSVLINRQKCTKCTICKNAQKKVIDGYLRSVSSTRFLRSVVDIYARVEPFINPLLLKEQTISSRSADLKHRGFFEGYKKGRFCI